ncbi:MAG: hypothetical protein AAF797_01565 [Planctomycetota bacterium]
MKSTQYLHKPEIDFGQPLSPQQRERAEAEAAQRRAAGIEQTPRALNPGFRDTLISM